MKYREQLKGFWTKSIPPLDGEWSHWWLKGDGGLLLVTGDLPELLRAIEANYGKSLRLTVARAHHDVNGDSISDKVDHLVADYVREQHLGWHLPDPTPLPAAEIPPAIPDGAQRNRLAEALATMRGAAVLILCFGSVFVVLGVISLQRLLADGPFAPFRVGDVAIPKFMGPGSSNLSVLLLSGTGLIAVLVSVLLRYLQHRKILRLLRSRGVTDYDLDGRTDSFADPFLDEL